MIYFQHCQGFKQFVIKSAFSEYQRSCTE